MSGCHTALFYLVVLLSKQYLDSVLSMSELWFFTNFYILFHTFPIYFSFKVFPIFPKIFPLAILRCQISAEIEAMAKAARSRKLQEQMP